MTTKAKKNNFLKFRIDSMTMNLLERARAYMNVNKSQFIRQSIREKAEAIIAEHEKTCFTTGNWHMFFKLLDNPPEPTERMKKAAQKYREITDPNAVFNVKSSKA